MSEALFKLFYISLMLEFRWKLEQFYHLLQFFGDMMFVFCVYNPVQDSKFCRGLISYDGFGRYLLRWRECMLVIWIQGLMNEISKMNSALLVLLKSNNKKLLF